MNERYPLPVVYGPDSMEITFTDATHCYVTYTRTGVQRINQVEYRGNAHLFLWSDGRFRIGQETETSYERRNQLFLNRVDWVKYSQSHASESARDKFASEVEQAVNNFAVNNPGIIQDAQREHLQNKYDAAADAASKAKEVYDQAVEARGDAHKALMSFRGAA